MARVKKTIRVQAIECVPGDVVQVELRRGGYGLAVVLRKDMCKRVPTLMLAGIDRKFSSPPEDDDVKNIRYDQCAVFGLQGDRAIREGVWPVRGKVRDFSNAQWPVPPHRSGCALHVFTDSLDVYVIWPGLICDADDWRKLPIFTGVGGADAAAGFMDVALSDRHPRWYMQITRQHIVTWSALLQRCMDAGIFQRKPGTYKDLYFNLYTEDDPRFPPVD